MRKTAQAIREKKLEELDITGFKLLPDVKPPFFHGSTVRNIVQYLWTKKIRPTVLEQQGKTCSICGWKPANDTEIKKLHLHEIEEYDFENKVCHLVAIELLCHKCHAFQHIMRAKSVSTKEGWEDLMQHFIKVNECSPKITDDFDLVIAKTLKGASKLQDNTKHTLKILKEKLSSDDIKALTEKTTRFMVSPNVPFAEEITKAIEKKGLLYQSKIEE